MGIRGLYTILAAMGMVLCAAVPSPATWRPEYAANPPAVREWFAAQIVMPLAAERIFHVLPDATVSCCSHADRLRTKFIARHGGDSWAYYPDPKCIDDGCPLRAIPSDTIHPEEIHAMRAKDDSLPEFEAMRREGVLMIWNDEVTCFWPPQAGM